MDAFVETGAKLCSSKDAVEWLGRANFTALVDCSDYTRHVMASVFLRIDKYDEKQMSDTLTTCLLSSRLLTAQAISKLIHYDQQILWRRLPFFHALPPCNTTIAALSMLRLLLVAHKPRVVQALQEVPELLTAVSRLETLANSARTDLAWMGLVRVVAAGLGLRPWRSRDRGHKGVRVLCLDGGGTKGVTAIAVLQQLKRATGREMHEMFDLVVGTSTGAIIAALIGVQKMSIDEIEKQYDSLIPSIFRRRQFPPLHLLSPHRALYDSDHWDAVLERMVGRMSMLDTHAKRADGPVVMCLATEMTHPAKLFVCRSANPPRGKACNDGSTVEVRHAIRMSSAAPKYFTPLALLNRTFCDGALVANNPAAVACQEASRLWPGTPLEILVSVGTGKATEQLQPYGWSLIIKQLIASATDTERVHETIGTFLEPNRYFRFNPEGTQFAIDETNPRVLAEAKKSANKYFDVSPQRERLDEIAKILLRKSSFRQAIGAWLS